MFNSLSRELKAVICLERSVENCKQQRKKNVRATIEFKMYCWNSNKIFIIQLLMFYMHTFYNITVALILAFFLLELFEFWTVKHYPKRKIIKKEISYRYSYSLGYLNYVQIFRPVLSFNCKFRMSFFIIYKGLFICFQESDTAEAFA